jgi:hypothetical protein
MFGSSYVYPVIAYYSDGLKEKGSSESSQQELQVGAMLDML